MQKLNSRDSIEKDINFENSKNDKMFNRNSIENILKYMRQLKLNRALN